MSNKLLFPGVSEKDIQKQQQTEQKRAAAQKKEQEHRTDAYKKYAPGDIYGFDPRYYAKPLAKSFGMSALCTIALSLTCLMMSGDVDYGRGDLPDRSNSPHLYTVDKNGKTVLTKNLIELAIVDIAVILALGLIIFTGTEEYKDFEQVKKIKRNRATVDMMLDLEQLGKKYNLNSRQVKRLVAASNDIIQKISADNPFYFDMLINGDMAIKNPETYKKMASEVILGHLQSHPSDAQRVLDIFNERSIPENVLEKIKAHQITHVR